MLYQQWSAQTGPLRSAWGRLTILSGSAGCLRSFSSLVWAHRQTQKQGWWGCFLPRMNPSQASVLPARSAGELWPAPQHLTEPVLLIAATSANEFRELTSRGSAQTKGTVSVQIRLEERDCCHSDILSGCKLLVRPRAHTHTHTSHFYLCGWHNTLPSSLPNIPS